MTIKNVTINTILTITLLTGHSYTLNMERNSLVTKNYIKKFYCADTKKDHIQHVTNSGPLGALPSETLKEALSTLSPLGDKLKTILALRTTCKNFYKSITLQYVLETFQHHTNYEKEDLLCTVANSKVDYWKKRTSFLMLSIATNNTSYHIVEANAIEAVEILNFNPEKAYQLLPYAQTPDMALKLFSISNVDLKDKKNTDILWKMFFFKNEKALEMTEFYIKNNVPLDTIQASDGHCLLHSILTKFMSFIDYDFENKRIKAIELIIDACPKLVNVRSNNGETSNDLALIILNIAQQNVQVYTCKTISERAQAYIVIYTNILKALNKTTGL